MEVRKIIERAEKQMSLGRFDNTSAINYINDALYYIAKRNSTKVKEKKYIFTHKPVKLNGVVVKFKSLKFENEELNKYFSIQFNEDSTITVYKVIDDKLVEITYDDDPIEEEYTVEYIGFKPVQDEKSEIDLPLQYETSLVFYIKHKMFEEQDEYERANYFLNQFKSELIQKADSKTDVFVKPSKYSLM